MADAVLGLSTSDGIAAEYMRTEFMDKTAMYNAETRDFRTELCTNTVKDVVNQSQRSVRFKKLGSDSSTPDFQHQDGINITIPDAERYGTTVGMTTARWQKEHPSSGKLRQNHQEALAADRRFSTQLVLKELLTDGGWYDGAMTTAPPPYAMNTFTTATDHYLAANVGGVPAYSHFTESKRTIQQHGFGMDANDGTRLVAFINGAQGEELENVADWVDSTNNRMDTELLEVLQRIGLTPSFMVAGIAVVKNDWIPDGYMTVFDPGEKICRWRITDNPVTENLIIDMSEDNVQYHGLGTYVRWGATKIVMRGAGVSYYLDGASWTDSTGWEV